MIKQTDQGLYDVTYHPKKQGRHVIMVTFAGQEVPRSPFEVNVGPYKETNIQVYGPGLTGGVVGYPAVFSVESNGETGALGKFYEWYRNEEIFFSLRAYRVN